MKSINDGIPPDEELVRLVAMLCDRTLDEEGRRRLEERLRDDPEALRYCAERIRFEAELNEVLDPAAALEWSESKHLVRSGKAGWEIRRIQTLRFGSSGRPGIKGWIQDWLGVWWFKWIAAGSLALLVALIWWITTRSDRSGDDLSPLILRNGDFEQPSLERSKEPYTQTILEWEDYFQTDDAILVDISRETNGRIMAHSGRNVARIQFYGFLTQRLNHRNGKALIARPGLKVRVSGWAYVEAGGPAVEVSAGLRYVASPYPHMFQYDPAPSKARVEAGGWKMFSIDLELPQNLLTGRVTKADQVQRPEKLDLTGRELTLSIDNRLDSGGVFLLDDLKVELLDPGTPEP